MRPTQAVHVRRKGIQWQGIETKPATSTVLGGPHEDQATYLLQMCKRGGGLGGLGLARMLPGWLTQSLWSTAIKPFKASYQVTVSHSSLLKIHNQKSQRPLKGSLQTPGCIGLSSPVEASDPGGARMGTNYPRHSSTPGEDSEGVQTAAGEEHCSHITTQTQTIGMQFLFQYSKLFANM